MAISYGKASIPTRRTWPSKPKMLTRIARDLYSVISKVILWMRVLSLS